MLQVCFDCYGSYTTDSVYQWDLNRRLAIRGLDYDSAPAIHFSNKKSTEALVVQSTIEDGVIYCDVPNILLREPYDIVGYVCECLDQELTTYETIRIPVNKRVKPADYAYEDNVEILTYYSLMSEITSVKASTERTFNSMDESKASKSELSAVKAEVVNNLDTEIAKVEDEIASERARIDQLVASPEMGEGDFEKEVEDLRIDTKGTTHGSAGTAVRNQIQALDAKIDDEVNTLSSEIEEFSNTEKIEVIQYSNGYWNTSRKVPNGTSDTRYFVTEPILFYAGESISFDVGTESTVVACVTVNNVKMERSSAEGAYSPLGVNKGIFEVRKDSFISFSVRVGYPYKIVRIFPKNSYANRNLYDVGENIEIVKNSGKFLNYQGVLKEYEGYYYSNPIKVKRGEVVNYRISGGTTNLCVLAYVDESGNFITNIADGNADGWNIGSERVMEDGYIMVSGNLGLPTTITIEKRDFAFSNASELQYSTLSLFENIGVIGDSYASGSIYLDSENSVTNYNLSWCQILARRNGVNVTNYTRGGLSTRSWLTDTNGLSKLLADEPKNLYILVLGINDNYHLGTDYLGAISDINDTDCELNADTFYGNYGKIISKIKTHAPNAKIIISTMASTTETAMLFNTAIEEIAEHYQIPCMKQYEEEFFTSQYYVNNKVGGHVVAVVYGGMALAFERMFSRVATKYFDYFKDYVG